MKSWIYLMFNTIKVFILFTGCTILFYYGLMWVNQEYQSYHRYDEPEGPSVKVAAIPSEEDENFLNRLWLFYHIGE